MADLYATLGVPPGASEDEIRSAYRALARKHHPDANPDDPSAEDRFKEISHAYDVLSDAGKRREYDAARSAFGGARPRPGGPSGPGGPGPGGDGGFGGFGDFADLFGSIFKKGPGEPGDPRAARRGGDVEVEVNLSFDQALRGAQVPVTVDKREACATCSGSGAKAGTSPRLCPECRGRGVVGRDAGGFGVSGPCPRCGGVGTVVDDPCTTCEGTGTTSARRRYNVKIPAGAKDGTKVRLRGRGQGGQRGGPAGDLIVITRVGASRLYSRKGDDLEIQVPVTFAEAALGAEITVPGPEGRIKLRVPPGSSDGRALRIDGQGAPKLNGGGRGDLIARLRVQVPRELSDDQRAALERFAELDARDPRETLFS